MSGMETFDRILESVFTAENLETVYPFENLLEDICLSPSRVFERHKYLRWDLLEVLGAKIEKITGRGLTGEEFFKVMNRVDQFLIERKFYIKP